MAETEEFDLIIPPGVPRRMIMDIMEEYDVDLVERKRPVQIGAMDGDIRELLAFRGDREMLEKVQDALLRRLKEFVGED
ncbi:MAG: hypothetical protein ACXQTG_01205 [Methanoculleaceae archaeon]